MKNVEDAYPLSPLQLDLLVHVLAAPGSGVGFEQKRFTLEGRLDPDAFAEAWRRILARHTVLRTAFIAEGVERPLQVVRRQVDLPFERRDWRDVPAEDRETRLKAWLRADFERGFDVRRAPLLRVTLIELDENLWEAVWSYHHLLLDAWSRDVVLREFLGVYAALAAGRAPELAPAHPFRDYIAWLKGRDEAEAEAFWRRSLADLRGPTPLPHLRPARRHAGFERVIRRRGVRLSESSTAALDTFARGHNLTLGTVFQGAWALLLGAYGGGREAVYGLTVSGRPSELPGIEAMVGMFINNLPVHVAAPPDRRLAEWLGELQETLAAIRRYEHSSPASIQEWSGAAFHQRLFETLVLFQNTPPTKDLDDLLAARALEVKMDARMETAYPVTAMAHRDAELPVSITYHADRLEAADAERILDDLVALLEAFPGAAEARLDELPLPAPVARAEEAGEEEARPAASRAAISSSPRSPVEDLLAEIWLELTGLGGVGVEENLFRGGGHSLLATQFVSRVRRAFRVELPLARFFERPTIAELAADIEAAMKAGEGLDEPPIEAGRRTPEGDPLSFAQERLWFVHQVDPDSHAFNIPRAVRLLGGLDPAILQAALDEVVRRHESLRTSFGDRLGEPVQIVARRASVAIRRVDLGGLAPEEASAAAERLLRREAHQPFDLARGPLARALLLRLAEDEHVALLTLHHIVSDAWSHAVLVRELAAVYRAFAAGEASPLPELPIQYPDFARWQRDWLSGEAYERQMAWWRERLEGAPDSPLPPTDRPRPEVQSFRGAYHATPFDEELAARLRSLGGREGATLFMTLLTAFAVLLHRITGEEDVVLGTDVANRNRLEVEGLIGFFVNNLVLRHDLSGNPPFRRLLGKVREETLAAYAHQDFPFDRLVQALKPKRSLSRVPLFQVLFVMQNVPASSLELPELRLEPVEIELGMSKFDLGLFITERDGVVASWHYSTDLYDEATVARLARDYLSLLDDICRRPDARLSELVLRSAGERRASKIARLKRRRRETINT